jgi:hypothetical protein
MAIFEEWCEFECTDTDAKCLWSLEEKDGGRAAIREGLIQAVRSHYDDVQRIANDIHRLGPIREGDHVGENEFAPSNHPIHVELIGAYMAAVPASRLIRGLPAVGVFAAPGWPLNDVGCRLCCGSPPQALR